MNFLKPTALAAAVSLALAAGCGRDETTSAERARGVPDNAAHQGSGPGVPVVPAPAALPGSGAASGVGAGLNPATGAGMGTVSGTNTGSTSGSADSTTPATGSAAGAGITSGAGAVPVDGPGAAPRLNPGMTGAPGANDTPGANDMPRSPGTDRGSPRSGDNKGAALDAGGRVAAAGPDARTIVLPLVRTAAPAQGADAVPQQHMPRPGAASMTITTGDAASGAAVGSVGAGAATRMKLGEDGLTAQPATSGIRPVPPLDRHFMDAAAVGGLFEVEAGQLAMERGTHPAVKEFGRMLVEDHGAANRELSALAATRSITLPSRLTKHQQSILRSLRKESGGNFDRQFIQEVGITDHRSDIRKFESAVQRTNDPDLKAFAEKTLPTLRKHHDHAQQLANSVGRGGGAAAAGAVPKQKDDAVQRAGSGTGGTGPGVGAGAGVGVGAGAPGAGAGATPGSGSGSGVPGLGTRATIDGGTGAGSAPGTR